MNQVVLTADLISSSSIKEKYGPSVLTDLEQILRAISDRTAIYCGDTFQVMIPEPHQILKQIFRLKAKLSSVKTSAY